MTFHDHFSGHAAAYQKARPVYPPALAERVAALTETRGLVWDAGTGNGQLAHLLAAHFDRVHATDASAQQVASAPPHGRITFAVEPAESPSLPDASVDAVTVAQAAHWFDLPRFYAAVRRVAKQGAPIVLAGYDLCSIAPEIDPLVRDMSDGVVGVDWPKERKLIDDRYTTLPFPFARIDFGKVVMEHAWRRAEFVGYVASWSAVRRFLARTGEDPIPAFDERLRAAWPDAVVRVVSWELAIVAGRVG